MAYLRRILRSQPSIPSRIPARLIPSTALVEEENAPEYRPEQFYPVRLYEILNDRYQVVTKLGPGEVSTVWLAKDLHQWRWLPPCYVAVKVKAAKPGEIDDELSITEHTAYAIPKHKGRDLVTKLLDTFTIPGKYGRHTCMVFNPLCEPLWMLQNRFVGKSIPLDVLKPITRAIIQGPHYLHQECGVVHTDLTPDNIMMSLNNPSVTASVAEVELINPSPRKQLVHRSIYLSRNHWMIPLGGLGPPIIKGFANAVRGDKPHNHLIQLANYQCPEVSLGTEWSYSADIWNLGVLVWTLLFGRGPFDQPGDPSDWTEAAHVAWITSLLGPLPVDLLRRGQRSCQYFNAKGQFNFPHLIETVYFGTMSEEIDCNDTHSFLEFIFRLLRWRPEDRPTAGELVSHPWPKFAL